MEPYQDLTLRLGPSEVEDDGLSPSERSIQRRLNIYDIGQFFSVEHIQTLIQLKTAVIERMSQLDQNPFWTEQRDRLISDSIVQPAGPEYKIKTLEQK